VWKSVNEKGNSVAIGRTSKLIEEIQERVDDIHTEVARLVVFANSTRDTALAIRLRKIAKVLFRSTVGIDRRLTKLRGLPSNGRRKGNLHNG
jgi:hypothetical protein